MFSCCRKERLNIAYKKERLEKKCIATTSFTLREVCTLKNVFPPRSKDISFPNNRRQSWWDSRLRKYKNDASKPWLTSNSFKLMHSKTWVYVFTCKTAGCQGATLSCLLQTDVEQILSRFANWKHHRLWTATPSCVCVSLWSTRLLMVSSAGCFLPWRDHKPCGRTEQGPARYFHTQPSDHASPPRQHG